MLLSRQGAALLAVCGVLYISTMGESARVTRHNSLHSALAFTHVERPVPLTNEIHAILRQARNDASFLAEKEVMAARKYPVCNSISGKYDGMLDLWESTIYQRCTVEENSLQEQCLLMEYMCCFEVTSLDEGIDSTVVTCDLESGFCSIRIGLGSLMLVGAWKANACGREGGSVELDESCQCSKTKAVPGDFLTEPCVFVADEAMIDPETKRTNFTEIEFGPYAVKKLNASSNLVNTPGTEPDLCVPVDRQQVRKCNKYQQSRAAYISNTCLRQAGTEVNGSVGQCCISPLRGSVNAGGSVVMCLIELGCIRYDSTHRAIILNDFAAAEGCLDVGGTISPPGAGNKSICSCVPGESDDKGCAFIESKASNLSCEVVDTAAGSLLSPGSRVFQPSLDLCTDCESDDICASPDL